MFAWAKTVSAVAVEPIPESLGACLSKCMAAEPELRPHSFAEISAELERAEYVRWGTQLQRCHFGGRRIAHDIAMQAAKYLAEVCDAACSQDPGCLLTDKACTPQEASEAYFYLGAACLRASRPADALKALQRSVLLCPTNAKHTEWLATLACVYCQSGEYWKLLELYTVCC
eukprot:5644689-Amphidinium_carterae.1